MWRPPERIKWEPQPGKWPSRKAASRSKLFSSINVGPVELEQRTWIPAMVPWRSTGDGIVTPEVLDWYSRFARGRPGAIVVEATGIRDIPSGPLLRIGDDRFVDGLRTLVETVRESSGGHTRLFIQCIDFLAIRRRPNPEKFLREYLTITDSHRKLLGADGWSEDRIREHLVSLSDEKLSSILDERELESLRMGYRERVTDTHLPQIAKLPQVLPDLFAGAAARAKDAGFDGIELHYAHAYTMSSLLSRLNTRQDGYGGTIENRLRLPLEVFEAVRATVGQDYAVGCRYLADDVVDGGNTVEDAAQIGVAFADAGMDFLSLSRGGRFEDAQQPSVGAAAYPYTGPSGYECMPQYYSDEKGPFGRNFEPSSYIRNAIRSAGYRTPVVVTGGVHGFQQAEDILAEENGDIIGFARQSLADPDWFLKVRLGRGAENIVCEYSNYCEALDQRHVQVTCKLWDRLNMDEDGILKTPDGKRRLSAPVWEPDLDIDHALCNQGKMTPGRPVKRNI
ncbi:MAG: NADH oxidase [Pelagibacteraceae bacterium]|nr:NADH oxidase [Pelagibacteraceae bacterium]PPR09941.1 MAG: NADH oxidase [Alphaproteobacteria bacterium MarineAlpha11_Bin1]|tara:strand:+ start:1480 stop:3003 length:1524 start_codon:yes stop_codon:yes gene_type:complete